MIYAYSIVILRDRQGRLLTYWDDQWQCPFFFHYRTSDIDSIFIPLALSGELEIPPRRIRLSFLGERTHQKYAPHAGEMRTYRHRFYRAGVSDYPEYMRSTVFHTRLRECRWMSLRELESDPAVRERNGDILACVRGFIFNRPATL